MTARVLTALLLIASVPALAVGAAAASPRESGAPTAPRPAVPPASNTFPIPAPYEATFTDDWHGCRDGCARRHKGNDIFADEGTPIVAVESGVIAKVDNADDSNAGLSIWLLGDSGVAYFYAHNSANFVTADQRVARGQLIGRVGRTGNARTTPPHIHFQINVCGELSSDEPCTVNPYGHLRRWPQGQIDGGADAVGLYRPSQAALDVRIEGGSALPSQTLGSPGAADVLPVTGDWDGDGRDTVGLYRRSDAVFVLGDGEGDSLPPLVFGSPGASDVFPVAGDWDGDGRDTVGLYRRSDAVFVLGDGEGGSLPSQTLGSPGASDVFPVAGDWDGDGRDSLGLYVQGAGTFQRREQGADLAPVTFGAAGPGVLPLVGDWDGDGRDMVGTFRQHNGVFTLSGPDAAAPAVGATTIDGRDGEAADVFPVAGDWNGRDLVTIEDLRAIFGRFADERRVVDHLPLLNAAMRDAGITTPARKAAFLATIHNESGFDALAVEPAGDRYRGRGFIQLTGAGNYRNAGTHLGVDLEGQPELAANPFVSPSVAAWYWTVARDINYAADRLDMAAVNIAVGFRPNPREDAQRCADFKRVLAWFSGGELPDGINCDRSRALQIPERPTTVVGSPADSEPVEAPTVSPSTTTSAPASVPPAPAPGPTPEAPPVAPDSGDGDAAGPDAGEAPPSDGEDAEDPSADPDDDEAEEAASEEDEAPSADTDEAEAPEGASDASAASAADAEDAESPKAASDPPGAAPVEAPVDSGPAEALVPADDTAASAEQNPTAPPTRPPPPPPTAPSAGPRSPVNP